MNTREKAKHPLLAAILAVFLYLTGAALLSEELSISSLPPPKTLGEILSTVLGIMAGTLLSPEVWVMAAILVVKVEGLSRRLWWVLPGAAISSFIATLLITYAFGGEPHLLRIFYAHVGCIGLIVILGSGVKSASQKLSGKMVTVGASSGSE